MILDCSPGCSAVTRLIRIAWLVPAVFVAMMGVGAADDDPSNSRRPKSDAELRYWLENLVWHHRFNHDEIHQALGLNEAEIAGALKQFDIRDDNRPARPAARLFVRPYPGGRHPRIGFLDGAVDPQRETKVSVFTPWQPTDGSRADYVVVDVPEAIWSNLGLTYLAHTHVPTIWEKQNVKLEPLEWRRHGDDSLSMTRKLPNGIEFAANVKPYADHVGMELTLKNGTKETLSDLRVQNCVMLREADGFAQQTNDNKHLVAPFAVVHNDDRTRWIITAWKPNHRTWGNAPCPCLHSDPKFPDCAPGETKKLVGWLSFYEGRDIEAELQRIEALDWSIR